LAGMRAAAGLHHGLLGGLWCWAAVAHPVSLSPLLFSFLFSFSLFSFAYLNSNSNFVIFAGFSTRLISSSCRTMIFTPFFLFITSILYLITFHTCWLI
jgi:hypothetical protein